MGRMKIHGTISLELLIRDQFNDVSMDPKRSSGKILEIFFLENEGSEGEHGKNEGEGEFCEGPLLLKKEQESKASIHQKKDAVGHADDTDGIGVMPDVLQGHCYK
jgi:hypothetical protein